MNVMICSMVGKADYTHLLLKRIDLVSIVLFSNKEANIPPIIKKVKPMQGKEYRYACDQGYKAMTKDLYHG